MRIPMKSQQPTSTSLKSSNSSLSNSSGFNFTQNAREARVRIGKKFQTRHFAFATYATLQSLSKL